LGRVVDPMLDPDPMTSLARTPNGWTYPPHPPCPCGASGELVGWSWCRCASAAESGGHLSYRCRGCDAVRVPECAGAVPMPGPMESYGCR
jgi:hypothetical protein